MKRLPIRILTLAALGVLAASASASAQSYDLAADFSLSVNPNGPWAYGASAGPSLFTAFTSTTTDYYGIGAGWTGTSPAGVAKNVGTTPPVYDLPVGKVGGHVPNAADGLAILWTAPATGHYAVSGGIWKLLDFNPDRVEAVSLYLNGTALFDFVTVPNPEAGTTSSHPLTFADAILADGGSASTLSDLPLAAGDTLMLSATRVSPEDFVGFDFHVAAVPEPASMLALGLGALGLLRRRSRRA